MHRLHLLHVASLCFGVASGGCAVGGESVPNSEDAVAPDLGEEETVGEASLAETVPAQNWNCDWSSVKNKQYKTCVGGRSCRGRHANPREHCPEGNLFYCENDGSPKKEICSNGCIGAPEGTDDQCK